MTYTKIQWGLLFFFLVIEVIWIHFSSFSFYYSKKEFIFVAGSFLLLSFLYIFYRKIRPDPIIITLSQSATLLLAYGLLMLGLSYLGATTNRPFVDSTLDLVDRFFGIYSPSLVFWFNNHWGWETVFWFIYNTYVFQFLFIIFYFSFRRETIPLQRFLMQFMIVTPLSILVGTFYPAAGPYAWYGYTPSEELSSALQHLLQLRQQVVDITTVDGILTLPSFHSVMALVFTYTFRNERKIIFIPIAVLNVLMIFSCIPIGGHYFADLLAAIPLFLLTVGIESSIFRGVKRILH